MTNRITWCYRTRKTCLCKRLKSFVVNTISFSSNFKNWLTKSKRTVLDYFFPFPCMMKHSTNVCQLFLLEKMRFPSEQFISRVLGYFFFPCTCDFRCCTTNTWWFVSEEDGRRSQVTYWSMTRAECCRSPEWMGKPLRSRASLRRSGTWIQTIIWLFLPITKPRRRLSEISFSCDWDSTYVGPKYFLKCSKFSFCFERTLENFRQTGNGNPFWRSLNCRTIYF